MANVLYLCDLEACNDDICDSKECRHTLDITHAKNFERLGNTDSYVEKEGFRPEDIIILKPTIDMPMEARIDLCAEIYNMRKYGVVVLPEYCEVVRAPSDVAITASETIFDVTDEVK